MLSSSTRPGAPRRLPYEDPATHYKTASRSGDIDVVEAEWLAAVEGEIAVDTVPGHHQRAWFDWVKPIACRHPARTARRPTAGARPVGGTPRSHPRRRVARYVRSGQIYETVLDTLHELYRDRESDLERACCTSWAWIRGRGQADGQALGQGGPAPQPDGIPALATSSRWPAAESAASPRSTCHSTTSRSTSRR